MGNPNGYEAGQAIHQERERILRIVRVIRRANAGPGERRQGRREACDAIERAFVAMPAPEPEERLPRGGYF